MVNDFSSCLNAKSQVDSTLLDFSNTSDRADHNWKLNTLKCIGNAENLWNWSHFPWNRTKSANVERSNKVLVKCGLPQGTVLDPLFFSIYINEIIKVICPKPGLFAYDSFLYRKINKLSVNVILQKDFDVLQKKWEEKCKMEYHPGKYQVFSEENEAKFLGVIIDSKL